MLPILSDLAHVARWELAVSSARYSNDLFGLDLCHADPARPLASAGVEPDDLDHDLSDLSDLYVLGVKHFAMHVLVCQEEETRHCNTDDVAAKPRH